MSKEATKRFVEKGLNDSAVCRQDPGGAEDVEMGKILSPFCTVVNIIFHLFSTHIKSGKCMANLNVKAGDSRDSYGRGRFFPFVPEHHLIPGHVTKDFWFWNYIYYPVKEVCHFYLAIL